jgi:hypothetical protein
MTMRIEPLKNAMPSAYLEIRALPGSITTAIVYQGLRNTGELFGSNLCEAL